LIQGKKLSFDVELVVAVLAFTFVCCLKKRIISSGGGGALYTRNQDSEAGSAVGFKVAAAFRKSPQKENSKAVV
jgi:hypothetical protein